MSEGAVETKALMESYVSTLLEVYGVRLQAAALYGSAARGDASFPQSDIDLLVVMEDFSDLPLGDRALKLKEAEDRFRRTPVHAEFSRRFLPPVLDLRVYTPEELARHPSILLDVIEDGVILYDKGVLKKELEALRLKLKELGAQRLRLRDGSHCWILKSNMALGEQLEL